MPYSARDPDYEEPLAAPSAMWVDLYALTMSQALFFENRHEQVATFHAFIRKTPFNASYLVTAGQNIVCEWLDKNWRFTQRDLRILAAKTVIDSDTGEKVPLFKPEFLTMIEKAELKLSLDMMPEGELAFACEPIYKVSGPLWQCLCVEAAILNTMNSQSNYATYAAILKTAANGKPVAEFGLRRAQGVGGLESTRGAYVGGIDFSSNCWAETNYNIPSLGTMAHAYVMIHETEMEAYLNWAKHNPHQGIFLTDTYEPIEGMKKAIEACKKTGIKLQGFRQDSGDLGYLASKGYELAGQEGYVLNKNTVSNDLDSSIIAALETQNGEHINMYAVGTKLTTCAEQPALEGIYKVGNIYENGMTNKDIETLKKAVRSGNTKPSAIRDKVRDIMKLSSQSSKMTYPGELDLIRYLKEENGALAFNGGTLYPQWDIDPISFSNPNDPFSGHLTKDIMSVRRNNHILSKTFPVGTRAYRPIQPAFKEGKLICTIETVHEARTRALGRLKMLHPAHKRLLNPHEHIIGIEESLLQRQESMGRRLRQTGNTVEANAV
ncbi:MAG: nicotinate phosphoribosyltransferase [Alphaproteobacteria bacterium]